MHSLKPIELSECAGLTDNGIEKLATLPRLKEITIHGSPEVTPAVESIFAPNVAVDYFRNNPLQ